MTHQAKAASAGSIRAGGSARGPLRRALATRGALGSAKESGAPSSRRAPIALIAALATIAGLAFTAAPALAAPSVTTPIVSDVAYTTAHVSTDVNPLGGGFSAYAFQVSTNGTTWTNNASGFFFQFETVNTELSGLDDATQYFVRVVANKGFGVPDPPETISAGPNPSFTTLTASPPTIPGVVAASGVFSTSAKGTAEVKRPVDSDDLKCHFEYVTDAAFGATGFAGATVRDCEQNPIKQADAGTNKAVTAPLGCTSPVTEAGNCLSPSTTYHLRLVAENAGGIVTKDAASTFTTLAPVAKPTIVAADDAVEVSKRTAQASGEVERDAGADPALDVSCRFEFVTDEQFNSNPSGEEFAGAGQAPCVGRNEVQSVTIAATAGQFRLTWGGNTTADIPFNISAEDLRWKLNEIIYYYDIRVDGGPGDGAGSTPYHITFIGGYADYAEKDVEQIVATNGTTPLAGTANVTTLASGANVFHVLNDPPMNQPKKVAAGLAGGVGLTGLQPGTTYHLRLVAENGGGTDTKSAVSTFTTVAIVPPTLTVDSVTEVGYTSFRAIGTADPGNQGIGAQFEYAEVGTEKWLGGYTPAELGPGLQVTETFPCFYPENGVGGCNPPLKPGTTYKLRLAGYEEETYSSHFVSPEPYLEFTTKGTNAPPIANLTIGTVTASTGQFTGTVDPNAPAEPLNAEGKAAYKTEWHIECVPDCKDLNGNDIGGTVEGDAGPQPVSGEFTRLDPHTNYKVRLITENLLGAGIGEKPLVTPLIKPTVKTAAGGSDGIGGYVIQGSVNPNNSKITKCKFGWGPEAHEELDEYAFQADCSPMPQGRDEVQFFGEDFHVLTYSRQKTAFIPPGSPPSVVQAELQALPAIGAGNVKVVRPFASSILVVTFTGALAETNTQTIGLEYLGGGKSPETAQTTVAGGNSFTVTVEAPLTGLTPDANYNFRLFATNGAGTEKTENRVFRPTLAVKEVCSNEQERKENSSLALPECRAYELVTPMGKEGFGARFNTYDGGKRVAFISEAVNILKSGQGNGLFNNYVAARTPNGWETFANLNGSSGSLNDAPTYLNYDLPFLEAYSSDLLTSVWALNKKDKPDDTHYHQYLRNPDGTFTRIGVTKGYTIDLGPDSISADLTHLLFWDRLPAPWGPGIYEYVGTSMAQPRRVDFDNLGVPVSGCIGTEVEGGGGRYSTESNASAHSISSDGGVVVFKAYGALEAVANTCVPGSPPANEIWARVNGTTSFNVTASHCDRVAPACNAPVNATFAASTPDGSRVFFTTTQQLVNADTDQTNDIYACDIPSGNPTPIAGKKANPCASFRQVSGAQTGAAVESFLSTSDNGATVLFVAKGVLADNEDSLGKKAVAGDRNIYVWRATEGDPDGQTAFVGRLDFTDLKAGYGQVPQFTPDGRYLVFTTATQLTDTDSDAARDVYRYDADTGELTRVSINVFGVAGNADAFPAMTGAPSERHPTTTVSDDGAKIVFTTAEPLSSLDGNAEPDVYLWTPTRVSLVSTGTVGFAPRTRGRVIDEQPGEFGKVLNPSVAIDPTGKDIYLETLQSLTPADGDSATDVYDVRIGGGFSFFETPPCTGESCQPNATPGPPNTPPVSTQPGPGNPPPPRSCPKGKVRKNGKCVKKKNKKQSGKKHHGKKASHKQGGGK